MESNRVLNRVTKNRRVKRVPRVFLISVEAQKKNLTSFSLDAERVRGPRRPELPSCSFYLGHRFQMLYFSITRHLRHFCLRRSRAVKITTSLRLKLKGEEDETKHQNGEEASGN